MNMPCPYTDLHRLFRRCLYAAYIHTGKSADYAVQQHGSRLYLLFECSNGGEDWKSNLNFPARAYQNGNERWFVHRGFLAVWKSVRDEIEAEVAARVARGGILEIVCVGYSHGAALCGLATEDMTFLYSDRLSVCGYGFGCPRFAWGPLPRAVQKRFEHFSVIRNIPDAVTYLPPAIMGYTHVGHMHTIGKKGKYSPIDAHRPESYVTELAKI
ncbi:MAG: hypothetical protein IJY20_06200 [Clostridia bacterium]|nr:hypothetical protein [Clostridia bacterium]